MVDAGLQALTHAADPSSKESKIAQRYLKSYFGVKIGDEKSGLIKKNLEAVQNFMKGNSKHERTPRLYCDDTWLERLSRTNAAWNTEEGTEGSRKEIMEEGPNGLVHKKIEDIKDYRPFLFTEDEKTGQYVSNGNAPYWSDDLHEYVFQEDYGDKSYCTKPGLDGKTNLAGTQDQSEPSTVTLCPLSFSNPQAIDSLGSKTPTAGMSIPEFLPKSATFYHELFHLAIDVLTTPDPFYSWKEIQAVLKKPTGRPRKYAPLNNHNLVCQNPETYVFFSVGYWNFLQTNWNDKQSNANKRWSFQSGVAQLVQID
ncbi:hypothetical protein PENVUL_c038G02194 [Penicillium vulpinum]|uniref:Uncharacterized protein n=2 Tax=Penicillium vulpinum TaxID=29845 RepID=A0A1V6RN20_9EURO|nr:hypothetical protein PENVUL_c038G02194 [Penicillium vulpinum]